MLNEWLIRLKLKGIERVDVGQMENTVAQLGARPAQKIAQKGIRLLSDICLHQSIF